MTNNEEIDKIDSINNQVVRTKAEILKKQVLVFIICVIVIVSQIAAATVTQAIQVNQGFANPFFLVSQLKYS